MIIYAAIVTILFIIAVAVAVVFGIAAKRFAARLMEIEDRLEESIDDLDVGYRELGALLSRPVFYDAPEIRRAINILKMCQTSILSVANKLAMTDKEENTDDDRTEEG